LGVNGFTEILNIDNTCENRYYLGFRLIIEGSIKERIRRIAADPSGCFGRRKQKDGFEFKKNKPQSKRTV
jgi:hypothetical protein